MYYTNGNTGILWLQYSLCSKDVLQYRRLIEKAGKRCKLTLNERAAMFFQDGGQTFYEWIPSGRSKKYACTASYALGEVMV